LPGLFMILYLLTINNNSFFLVILELMAKLTEEFKWNALTM